MDFVQSLISQIKVIIDQKHVNQILTATLTLVSLYCFLVSFFDRNIADPLRGLDGRFVVAPNGTDNPTDAVVSGQGNDVTAVISLFFLWALALVFGKISHHLCLPPLLGMLLAGIFFGNVPVVNEFLKIDRLWDLRCRELAFLIILIRASIGLDPFVVKKSIVICFLLGIITTLAEAASVTLASHFLFEMPLFLAIVFSFVLTSTSPAVTVPTMIELQREKRGTEKGIPTVVLASATFDNLFCITAFYVTIALFFSQESGGDLMSIIPRVVIEVAASGLIGIGVGILLRLFPHFDTGSLHFTRSAVSISVALAVFYGSKALKFQIAGPVIVFIGTTIAAARWKVDNPAGTRVEERALAYAWRMAFQPLLFGIIGQLLKFQIFTWELVIAALAILGIGVVIRIIAAFFVIVFFRRFSIREKIFMSICFVPKATVQAALAPILLDLGSRSDGELAVQTCILSILVTAPLGQFIIMALSKLCLVKANAVANGETGSKQFSYEADEKQLDNLPIENTDSSVL